MRVEHAPAFGLVVPLAGDVDDVELPAQAFCQAGTARNEIARLWVGADAHGYAFEHGPLRTKLLAAHVVVKCTVYGAGDALQGHLSQGNEVAAAEKVRQGALGTVDGVNIAAAHASGEGFGSDVADDDFIGTVKHPIRHLLAHGDARECLDAGSHAFDVLDVHGAEHVDVVVEQ